MVTHRDHVCTAFNNWENKPPSKSLILDVGCRGKALKPYFESRDYSWTGLDLHGAGDIIKSDMSDMQMVDDNTYDLLFSCHAFEHCERPIDALREFKRVLKVGGWLFIATPYPNKHHILDADKDHIFCLNVMQMTRLLKYTEFSEIDCKVDKTANREQDWNIISVGRKENES